MAGRASNDTVHLPRPLQRLGVARNRNAAPVRCCALILIMASFQRVCWKLPHTQRIPSYRETMMRFYTQQHRFYCGIDLHARLLAVCILDHNGSIVYQKQLPADPQMLLDALAPFRPDVAVCVECMFAWYWVADLCRR